MPRKTTLFDNTVSIDAKDNMLSAQQVNAHLDELFGIRVHSADAEEETETLSDQPSNSDGQEDIADVYHAVLSDGQELLREKATEQEDRTLSAQQDGAHLDDGFFGRRVANTCVAEETRAESGLAANLVQEDTEVDSGQAVSFDGLELIGEWATEKGHYAILPNSVGQLIFVEDRSSEKMVLTGVLTSDGDFWQAKITDQITPSVFYGHLRLKREGSQIRSSFKFTEEEPWDEVGYLANMM